MSNITTEKNGLAAVIEYEKQHGRSDIKRVHKCGYDILSKGNGEERHIEVKTTSKGKFTQRWLEELEYQALQNDDLFWVYLVTNTNDKPNIRELSSGEVKKRFKKETTH